MNHAAAIVVLALLLFGPLAVTAIEHNIELYCLALGVLATLFGTGFTRDLVLEALHEPVAISVAVIVAALLFGWARPGLDTVFRWLRGRVSRPVLTDAMISGGADGDSHHVTSSASAAAILSGSPKVVTRRAASCAGGEVLWVISVP